MSMTETAANQDVSPKQDTPKASLWGRLFKRDTSAQDKQQEERDMILITAALMRLNERQLNRIGLSRATLSLDVDDLARRAKRDTQLTSEILRIVESAPEGRREHAIAAE